MKKGITLLFFLYLHNFTGFTQTNDASIQFEKNTHNFGDIKEADGSVSYSFQFTNHGPDELHIKDVVVSCGCTTPLWTQHPLKPGEKGFIEAVFDPTNRPGTFNKALTVFYNKTNDYVDLFITGNVIPVERTVEEKYSVVMGGVRVESQIINFQKITNEKPVTLTISVYNEMSKSAKWEDDYDAPDHVQVKFLPERIPAKSFGEIEVIYDPRRIELLGYKGDKLVVSTNEWFNSTKRFIVVAFIEEYFPPLNPEQLGRAPILKIDKPIHEFGRIRKGEILTHDFVITNVGKEALNIRMTRASCGCTVSKPEKNNLMPGESGKIHVTFNSEGKSGDQEEIILLFSNDPTNPTQKLRIRSRVMNEEED